MILPKQIEFLNILDTINSAHGIPVRMLHNAKGKAHSAWDDAADAISGAWKAQFHRHAYRADKNNLGNAEYEIVPEVITDENKLLSE